MPRNYGRIDEKIRERAFDYFQRGFTNKEVADRLQLDKTTVCRWRKKMGARPAPPQWPERPLAPFTPTRKKKEPPPPPEGPVITVKLPPPESSTNRDIGQRLVYLRQKSEIFQSTAARRLGVSSSSVLNSYEGGHRGTPIRVLVAASKAYDVSLDWLITGTEKQPNAA